MKKLTALLSAVALMALLSGCASAIPQGGLFTEVTLPAAGAGNVSAAKTGTSECTSILGMVATGDCSIEAAARNGKISKISHVDFKASNILGIFGKYTTTVYGD